MRAHISAGIRRAGYVGTLFLLVLGFSIELTAPAYAMDDQQRKIFDNGVDFYNYKDGAVDPCGAANAAAAATPTGGGGGGGPAGSAKTDVPADFTLGPLEDGPTRRKKLISQLMADFPTLNNKPDKAVGFIGNFTQESGGSNLPPNVNQGGGRGAPTGSGGYGWAQWTGGRNANFRAFGDSNPQLKGPSGEGTDAWNYAYLKWELQGGYAKTITALDAATPASMGTTTQAEASALSVHNTFEGSADGPAGLGERGADANKALAEFNGTGTFDGGGNTGGAAASEPNEIARTGGKDCSATGPGSVASSAECGTSAECAKKLLDLSLLGVVVLRTGAQQNLQTAADGQQLAVCPQGPVTLNASIMQVLIRLSSAYRMEIHNFSAPNHSCDGAYHTKGRASDVHLAGQPADCGSLGSGQNKAFAQAVMDILPPGGGLGQQQCIGQLNNTTGKRYFVDGDQHFHIDVGADAP